jgi:ribose 5-phosphate isomerase RpiB
MMRIGIAADHGGFELKVPLTAALKPHIEQRFTDTGTVEAFTLSPSLSW